MSEWQPIETAPKDGRLLLVYPFSKTGRPFPVVATWDTYIGWTEAIECHLCQPTHWMPLPEPPQ